MSTAQRNGPRYRIDDSVYFSANSATLHGQPPQERFIVVAVMPQDRGGLYQYRIRPSGAGPHRIATEPELRRPS